ncbi:MAG: phosphoribosylaminoimidazolesuccinocarboxamide synthase [Spirochaetes bacterium]|nr:phosphoribosylaminoimidazolesuccinocarboxamide synthase [Spirochaetota bacterium]
MVEPAVIEAMLAKTFLGLDDSIPGKRSGKVRDWYELGEGRRLLVTTDRISAFDRVIGSVPWKGQILNELSAWWNLKTADIVPNHLISVPDPNASIVLETKPLPVEVVVRGYITGVTSTSLWRRYSEGDRSIYGYSFPEGLEKNGRLLEPIVTPTTKAEAGAHDERLTCAEVVDRGLVGAVLWKKTIDAALSLFERGSRLAAEAGIILVDTKYEFGLGPEGNLTLIDEVHTPDSSRFWKAGSYEARLAEGKEPEIFDKEFVRLKYAELGYRGDGPIPTLPPSVWAQAGALYQKAYEALTGKAFKPGPYPVGPRLVDNLFRTGARL